MGWRLVADAVVLVHGAFVLFVVAGCLLALRWRRAALVHLPAVVYGAMIELIGFTCPLTPLEKSLRRRAGSEGYDGGFVEHYVVPVLYPGELTQRIQVLLATMLVLSSAAVYGVVWQRARRSPGASPGRGVSTPDEWAPESAPSTTARCDVTVPRQS